MDHRLHRLSIALLLVVLCASALVPAPVALAQDGTDDPGEIPLQVDVTTPPLDSKKSGGIAYFLFDTQKKIKRFNLQTGAWMADITFASTPTAMAVDADGLYVGFGTTLIKYSINGTNPVQIYSTSGGSISKLSTCGSHLYMDYGIYESVMESIDKSTGQLFDQKRYVYQPYSVIPVCSKSRMYASIGGLKTIALNSDGTFGNWTGHPNTWPYVIDTGQRNVLSPDENRLANSAGHIINTVDFSYNKSISPWDDMDFRIDQPVLLYSGEVIGYTRTLVETGRYQPAQTPFKLFTHADKIYAFSASNTGVAVEQIAGSKLRLPAAGQPVNPVNLKYRPDMVVVDKDSIVYLLDRNNYSVYRWSIPDRKYLSTISLAEAAIQMTYDSTNHRLYLAYPNRQVNQINLSSSLQETPFVTTPNTPWAIAMVDEFVLLGVESVWNKHMVYDSAGTLVSEKDAYHWSKHLVWNAATRKVYFFRDDAVPNDLLSEEISDAGIIGNQMDSPYHGGVIITYPIRITPDGSKVLLGSGDFYDATTLAKTNALPNSISDAAWSDGTLYTIYPTGIGTKLQKWSADLALIKQAPLIGEPGFLFNVPEGLLAITYSSEVPVFSIWTTDLEQLFPKFSWTYLPVCTVDYCPDFMDTFDTDRGWTLGEGETVRVELLNGDYRILVKEPWYMWSFASPSCPMDNYSVKTSVRWEKPGYSYSLLFGIDETMEHFYILDIDPLSQRFALYYYNGVNFYPSIGSTPNDAIRPGYEWNNIEVQVYGNRVRLIINNQLIYDGNQEYISGKTRVGVSVTSAQAGYADARFSYFSVQHLDEDPSGSASLSESAPQSGGSSSDPRPGVQIGGIDVLDLP